MLVNAVIAIAALVADLIVSPYIVQIINAAVDGFRPTADFTPLQETFITFIPYLIMFFILFAFFYKITHLKNNDGSGE